MATPASTLGRRVVTDVAALSVALQSEHTEALARRERMLREGFVKLEQEQAAVEEARAQLEAMRADYERKFADLQVERARLEADRAELAARERRVKEREDVPATPGYVEALPMQHPSPSREAADAKKPQAQPGSGVGALVRCLLPCLLLCYRLASVARTAAVAAVCMPVCSRLSLRLCFEMPHPRAGLALVWHLPVLAPR